jgi:hypothetical protein
MEIFASFVTIVSFHIGRAMPAGAVQGLQQAGTLRRRRERRCSSRVAPSGITDLCVSREEHCGPRRAMPANPRPPICVSLFRANAVTSSVFISTDWVTDGTPFLSCRTQISIHRPKTHHKRIHQQASICCMDAPSKSSRTGRPPRWRFQSFQPFHRRATFQPVF